MNSYDPRVSFVMSEMQSFAISGGKIMYYKYDLQSPFNIYVFLV